MLETIKKDWSILVAPISQIGWVFFGVTKIEEEQITKIISIISIMEEDKQFQKFWEIEEVPTVQLMREVDRIYEEMYEGTVTRGQYDTYTTNILFKEDPRELGLSQIKASERTLQLEKFFNNDTRNLNYNPTICLKKCNQRN
ncbi:hypothetical protein WA026_019496 [Henosepilachna vigintioctopunctata]|uniref:Uncharacterized protein n=1 Tax=Henosepilachna vigintioctopunctata TaxID=420089 RepID=A0AAW1TVS5_9CUCU